MTRLASTEPESAIERDVRPSTLTFEPACTRPAERPPESRPRRSFVPSLPYVAALLLVVALAALLWWTA